jgi:16S rRNA (cytosine1402-N4)-methyltransferase
VPEGSGLHILETLGKRSDQRGTEEDTSPSLNPQGTQSMTAAQPQPRHQPVLVRAVLEALALAPGQTVVDATVGAGRHARLICERLGPAGRLIALDQDASMLELARPRLHEPGGPVVNLVHASFDDLRRVLDDLGIATVDAVLADLGVCSDQLDQPERGLSFQEVGPLDMRLNREAGEPASAWLRRLNERDLADLFWRYGEERFSRRIARRIVATRRSAPLRTTEDLARLVRSCIPRPRGRRRTIDPATRVFQALRIAVNDELGALDRLLETLPACLGPGGRAVVISFHSLEDRRVKQAFRDRQRWQVLTAKPVQAEEEEVARNPRARSAKMRAARRL